MEVGGWVQVSLGKKSIGKSSQNSPIRVLIFWSSIPCRPYLYNLFVYQLMEVVSYYELSVLPMSVMGFQTKLDRV